MNGISVEEDDERITAIRACIDDDDSIPTGSALEIGEERGKKGTGETRQRVNICHNSLHFKVESVKPFMLICTS